ncbi:hypothetical protein S40288_01566 [Stachybotrys chartarum IBT 40288]|nr:hypothetical protein S40288_01566 [Stachybotrys chartarum IBT 40288]
MGFFSRNKVKKSPSCIGNGQPQPQPQQNHHRIAGPPAPPPNNNFRNGYSASSHDLIHQRPSHMPLQRAPAASSPSQHHAYYQPASNFHPVSHSQPHFQPAGYPSPAQNWTPPPQQQVVVNNHYYMGSQPHLNPPHQQRLHPQTSQARLGHFAGSMVDLAKDVIPMPQFCEDSRAAWHSATQLATSSTSACDDIFQRFGNLMTMIDGEKLRGNEKDLFSYQSTPNPANESTADLPMVSERGLSGKTSSRKPTDKKSKSHSSGNVAASVVTGNYFSKVEHYANSKLPRDLPRLALYIPTWPLLCLAAQYSQRVYDTPKGAESEAHVSADWFSGTKAMCIKSVPMDHMNTIVFAIRGTSSFMDWAVNLNTEPTSPGNFLDDPGNLCHAGFLSVARRMVKPVASRLRQMLQENPGRAAYSLLITGHSAGGAVAALLYSHMLSVQTRSELTTLTGCFKRVHCVTFGAPPVSLLPLLKPNKPELRKSIFMSILNEGDPVARADKAYVRSLLELLSAPVPSISSSSKSSKDKKSNSSSSSSSKKSKPQSSMSNLRSKASKAMLKASSTPSSSSSSTSYKPAWKVPPGTLSNAGRIVVLRSGDPYAKPHDCKTVRERLAEGVVAVTCREEQLRGVIWGDPVCHLMNLYAGRIEILAVGAVTAQARG